MSLHENSVTRNSRRAVGVKSTWGVEWRVRACVRVWGALRGRREGPPWGVAGAVARLPALSAYGHDHVDVLEGEACLARVRVRVRG